MNTVLPAKVVNMVRPIGLDKPMRPKEAPRAPEQGGALLGVITARRGKVPFADVSKLRRATAAIQGVKDVKVCAVY